MAGVAHFRLGHELTQYNRVCYFHLFGDMVYPLLLKDLTIHNLFLFQIALKMEHTTDQRNAFACDTCRKQFSTHYHYSFIQRGHLKEQFAIFVKSALVQTKPERARVLNAHGGKEPCMLFM